MVSSKIRRREKLQTRKKIADQMLYGAIPWYLDVERRTCSIVRGRDQEYMESIADLARRGCDLRSLHAMLDMGKALMERAGKYSVPKTKSVKRLTRKMRYLAKEIRAAECNNFMAIMNRGETAKWRVDTGLGPEDVADLSQTFPFLALPKWLEKRASMYEEWLRLASQKILPKDIGVTRLARVCLALYVRHATRQTCFPQVTTLLECAGLGKFNAAQLSRELKDFESGYPMSCNYLRLQFTMLCPPDRNSGKLVVRGIAADLLKSGK